MATTQPGPLRRRFAVAGCAALALLPLPAARAASKPPPLPPAVVVATFDTGTNPFHPCFRRPGLTHPKQQTPRYPAASRPLPLALRGTYAASLAASRRALEAIKPETLYHVPGTNLSFYGGPRADTEFVDDYPHGAQASSQIACPGYGLAPDAHLVVVNWYDDIGSRGKLLAWAVAQPWIDVVHLNVQDIPTGLPDTDVAHAVASGKLVVIAAGNGVLGQGANYPMELSSYNAPRGSLIAGANDNDGYTVFSNLDPHVVMDGVGTRAAAPAGFGTVSFAGTSSSSPRTAGYAARLIADVRAMYGHTGTGLVTIPSGRRRPKAGPLADGKLTAAELHEVIRKTADPNPHPSAFDGTSGWPVGGVPLVQPMPLPFAFYPKMGYGEVSEHTVAPALAVLSGVAPMPVRPAEDSFYAASESLRR
ncbi:MAG TPA: S8/S53 family peptidase [Frankiaceae bacterium]|nr:S8/S53 family peptidase [Frankiaceae bacterium]